MTHSQGHWTERGWSYGASFSGDSSGASSASSDSEEESASSDSEGESSSRSSASSPGKLPEAVCQAAEDGDIETVNAWLRTAPDVNAVDKYGRTLLYLAARGKINAPKVDLARRLLDLGADVNSCDPSNEVTSLHIASRGKSEEAVEMVRLLLLAGADVNARTRYGGVTPMGYFPLYANRDTERVLSHNLLVICKLLLRAGASIDDVNSRTDWQPDTSMEARLQKYAKPADDEQWLAVKRLVADVRAAGGTYRVYLHEHRKQVLMLRCLATKGRATTTDPVMNFLEQLGDNGVIWKVLSFWPPPP